MSLFVCSRRVQKVSPSWVLQDLSVLLASPEPLGLDDPVPEGPPALLAPRDLHLHMIRVRVCVCVKGKREGGELSLHPLK